MNNKKTYLAWTLRIIIAILFIVSALAKLSKSHLLDSPYFAISTFEMKQLIPLGFSMSVAPYFSRILFGIELALGILILQNNWLKKFIIPVTILMLMVFIGHLSYVTFLTGGTTGNCGCFGEMIPMTPIESIVKNVIAVGLLVLLFKILPNQTGKYENFWVLTTVLFASILWIFMIAPIQPPAASFTVSPMVETPMEGMSIDSTTTAVTTIDSVKTAVAPTPEVKKDSIKKAEVVNTNEPKNVKSGNAKYFASIDKGKKILCYFVPGCDHCRAAAKELNEMRKKDASFPPISVLFMNEEADLIPDFFKEAGTTYPYKIIEIIPFWDILGKNRNTPGVKYFWNGNEILYQDGIEGNKFNGEVFNTYLHKSYQDLKKANPKL